MSESSSGTQFDPKTVNPLDWGLVAIAPVLLILSFFGYYVFSFSFRGTGISIHQSYGAWHTGSGTIVGWFAFAIGLLSSVVVALDLFVPTLTMPAPARLVALGGFALSFVLYVLGFFVIDIGPGHFGFSYWVSFVLVIAGVVVTFMRLQQTGPVPGFLNKIPKVLK
jgi:hypothetical protein